MGRGWDMAAFWIATAYSIYTFVVPIPIQHRVLLAINVDPHQRLVIWGFGLAAFFLYAGFRAWEAEHRTVERLQKAGAVPALAGEVERLRTELDQRALREWPRLTDSQKTKLAERLGRIGSHTIWIIRPENFDCVALAADFDEVFRKASWNVPEPEPYSVEGLKLGITIYGLQVAAQEALREAIIATTGLPATIYEGSERERKSWNEEAIVLNVGVKRI